MSCYHWVSEGWVDWYHHNTVNYTAVFQRDGSGGTIQLGTAATNASLPAKANDLSWWIDAKAEIIWYSSCNYSGAML